MNQQDWLNYGVEHGFIYPTRWCVTHDYDPHQTAEEAAEVEAGGDPCCPVVKFRN